LNKASSFSAGSFSNLGIAPNSAREMAPSPSASAFFQPSSVWRCRPCRWLSGLGGPPGPEGAGSAAQIAGAQTPTKTRDKGLIFMAAWEFTSPFKRVPPEETQQASKSFAKPLDLA
jgi:hypothetical protein